MGVFIMVSIVLVTYLKDNQKYLDLCMESIKRQTFKDYEVILVSSGEHSPTHPDWITHHHSDERLHFADAINHGVRRTNPSSKYILLLSDDCVMTETSLEMLVGTIGEGQMILNPISTCDNNSSYSLVFAYEKNGETKQLTNRFYRYDDLSQDIEYIMKTRSIYPVGIVLREYVAFYATMIPRSVWEKVGELDQNFKTGQEDADYCKRAKQQNIPSGFALNSFILHFGGVTADQVMERPGREQNIKYYKDKWGEYPP
jgi:GT2 family glycosyltransferase